MKKLLSIILAAAMILSLVPSVFAVEGEETVYTYSFLAVDYNNTVTTKLSYNGLPRYPEYSSDEYAEGERNWKYHAMSDKAYYEWEESAKKDTSKDGRSYCGFDNKGLRFAPQENSGWFTLKLRVPETGLYQLSYIPVSNLTGFNQNSTVSILPKTLTKEAIENTSNKTLNSSYIFFGSEKTGYVNFNNSTTDISARPIGQKVIAIDSDEGEGEVIIAFTARNSDNNHMRMRGLTLTKVEDDLHFDVSNVALMEGESVQVTASLENYTTVGWMVPEYDIVDENIATVNSKGIVTAVGEGDTTLTARIGDATATIPVKVTAPAVTPEYEEAFGEDTYTTTPGITFDALEVHALAYATDGSAIAPANIKATDNENGTYTVTTDAEADGYTFRYWAKGLQSKERKRIVSFANEFTYTPSNEKNYLIAVYDKAGTEPAMTEYYNANGQLIPNADDNAKVYMAGYGESTGWKESVYGIKEATYGEPIKYDITIGDAEPVEYAWGTPVECPEPTEPEGQEFWGWKKTVNDVDVGIVSTDPNYTFYAWESCTVTPVFGVGTPVFDGEKRRIILGTFLLGGKTAVMAEFFGFDDAFERGITIDGTDYAMTNKNADQFTIVDDDNKGNISGYAILEGGLKLIYNLPVNNAE